MRPKVSIISVYYNRSFCVDESINSLLVQKFQDFELILVDDGSIDNTLEQLKNIDDSRVKVITHANIGFTNSIIKAVEAAQGEYIAVHGSGDISFPERIEREVFFLDNNPDYGVVASRFERYDETSQELIEVSSFSGEIIYSDFLKNCRVMHGVAMFRKSIYEEVGGYERIFKTTQDWDLFLRFLKVSRGWILDEVLYRQIKRSDGIDTNTNNYIRICQTAALRVLLATKTDARAQILKDAYSHGIDHVIEPGNREFQHLLVLRLKMLVRRGRYSEMIKFSKDFNHSILSFVLRVDYLGWLFMAKLFQIIKLDRKYIISFFSLPAKIRNGLK